MFTVTLKLTNNRYMKREGGRRRERGREGGSKGRGRRRERKGDVISVYIYFSDRVMRLRCQMEKSPSSGVLWCNVITQVSRTVLESLSVLSPSPSLPPSLSLSQVLDEIPPRESLEIKCNLLPILPGLQVTNQSLLLFLIAPILIVVYRSINIDRCTRRRCRRRR